MMNNSNMVSSVIKLYSEIRFRLLFNTWLVKAKERIPELEQIDQVFYPEDLGCSLLQCGCNDISHRIRFWYRIDLKNGTTLKCGTRCLQTIGYPKSLSDRLDKMRRIIQRDVETIVPLEPDVARTATSMYKMWMQVITDHKQYPGLKFVELFGTIAIGFMECDFDLPQWLRVMLKRFYSIALKEAPRLQAKRLVSNREKYKNEFEFLSNLNDNIIYGRNPWVKEILALIDKGEKLFAWQINKIKELKDQESKDTLIARTEMAIPYLMLLTDGSIKLTTRDANPPEGQKTPFFLSCLEHLKKSVVLSARQLEAIRWKCNTYYMGQINKIPAEKKMTTHDLMKIFKTLDPKNPKYTMIKTILLQRNVDIKEPV